MLPVLGFMGQVVAFTGVAALAYGACKGIESLVQDTRSGRKIRLASESQPVEVSQKDNDSETEQVFQDGGAS